MTAANRFEIKVDIETGLQYLGRQLSEFSTGVQKRALPRGLNTAMRTEVTKIRHLLTEQTNLKYRRVSAATKVRPANQSRLVWTLTAQDKPTRISDVKNTRLTPGKKEPTVRPWGQSQRLKKTFVIRFRTANREGHTGVELVTRKWTPGGNKIKVIQGPRIPVELLREGKPTLASLKESVPRRVIPEVLRQQIGRAHV